MGSIIATSTTAFTTLFGFSLSDLVTWVVSQILFVLGLALGLIVQILPVVVGIMAIGAVVFLIYKVLHWMHIIK